MAPAASMSRSGMAYTVDAQALTHLCAAAEVPEDEVKRVNIEGRKPLAVYCVGGRFHASDDTCTHADASLSEGMVDEGLIECPFHGGTFDIATGAPVDPPCTKPLQVYPVELKDGQLFAALDKDQ